MTDQNKNTCNDKSPWIRTEEEIAEFSPKEFKLSVWFSDDEEFIEFSEAIEEIGLTADNLNVKFDENIPDGFIRLDHSELETFKEFPIQNLLDMLSFTQNRMKFKLNL